MMNKRLFIRLIFIIWISIWILFLVRPYFKMDLLDEYKKLASLSTEEKRAFVTGRDLYNFLMFCKNSIDAGATYKVVGLEDGSIAHRRAVYYLYPNIEARNADFIFVYKADKFNEAGYDVFRMLDPDKYILKRTR